jgi:secreted trypsin-like serine protease
VLGALGCGEQTTQSCVGQTSRAIYGGTADALAAGLPDEAFATAVGAVTWVSPPATRGLCSGVLVAPDLLLTAAHCASGIAPASVHVSFGSAVPSLTGGSCPTPPDLAVNQLVRHPTSDVMLVQLSTPPDGIAPVPIADVAPTPGASGIIAGYGLTAQGTVGARMFVATTVTQADGDTVTINSGPDAGACAGDSGGPLFVPGDGSNWQLAGVLSEGSVDCVGVDVFTTTSSVRAWLDSLLP